MLGSLPVCSAALWRREGQVRHASGRVPNKGIRELPAVPDRLKDAVAYFGNDSSFIGEDTPFVPAEKRQNLMKEVMGMQQNLKNVSKLDRLKTALEAARQTPANSNAWKEAYMFTRTSEQCTELIKNEFDDMPKGNPLWIDMTECEEARLPHLCQMPNGLILMPSFSFEEYMNHYFQRIGEYDTMWFPVPRMGTKYDDFCALPFPVCCTGKIQNMCSLATVAYERQGSQLMSGAGQFGLVVNPNQTSTKFLSFPEMIRLARKETFSADEIVGFHPCLQRCFDTSKITFKRLSMEDAVIAMKKRPTAVPPVAQLELHLLLFDLENISRVYVRNVNTPRWKRLLGKPESMTQIDIVVFEKSREASRVIADRLTGWSFLKEFDSDVHIEITTDDVGTSLGLSGEAPVVVAPQGEASTESTPSPRSVPGSLGRNATQLLYDNDVDGGMYRKMVWSQGGSLKSNLGYDDPLEVANEPTPKR
jgi:hypothetical protein